MSVKISVCIPCYKSERFIRTTIESVLAQTVPASEILISDDHSPDRTLDIVMEYRSMPGVRILRPKSRLTLGGHYRFLLQEAAGDYICFLSHDDALMPFFIETMCQKLDDDAALIAGACLECSGALVPQRVRGMALPRKIFPPPEGFLHFLGGNGYTISVSLMSRRFLLEIPSLPPEADLATDWYWAIMLGLKGKVSFERKPLGYYRIHSANAGHNNPTGWWLACEAMLEFLKSQPGAEYKAEIENRLKGLRKALAAEGRGEPVVARPLLKQRIKDFAKNLIALRYRHLPLPISRAEQGIGVALERARLG